MDLNSIGKDVGQILPTSQSLIALAIICMLISVLYLSSVGKRIREVLTESVFSNWRLALLGATGLVLSLASGWTTWDGMRNFTHEPLLSLMITFGIQGVMLIAAWLIGESFATGMNYRPNGPGRAGNSGRAAGILQPVLGTIIGLMLFGAVAVVIVNQFGGNQILESQLASQQWAVLPNGLLFAAIVILLVATLAITTGKDILSDYLQAVRVTVRSAVLWVMFLACMATSVFFSFDSLFSNIFPKEERARAAELRAQNQVAGVVNDIGNLAGLRRIEERDRLFETDAWLAYDRVLEDLVTAARQAPKALQDYFEQKMRERQEIVARRQEEKAAAVGQQVRLKQRSKVLGEEITRTRGVVAQLTPVVEDLKSKVFAKDREIVAKQAEAEAEAGGIGVTSKVGRGPKFREISGQLRVLREQKKNYELQLREFEKRLRAARQEASASEGELSATQGDIATQMGRAETASRLIELAEKTGGANEPAIDPSDGMRQLERARVAFRQAPNQAGLAQIQSLCTTLVGAMTQVPSLKAEARKVDCDPGQASEAAERVFGLNAGIKLLAANCIGGERFPKSGGTDALFGFARQCVQDAGLPSRDTHELRTRINYLELNRDDKAHRFVVTSNAFQDGNKLAYLALGIAIAIDALVFMSGLFGANAVRSPLSDVPSHKGRSARQLEAVIDVALQPHAYETARLVLGSLRPITPRDGFTGEIVIEDHDPHGADLRRVLNAGSSIGAVRQIDNNDRVYQVRAELFEYLSIAANREYEKDMKDKSRADLAELERTVAVALMPDVTENANLVLSFMHPMIEQHGFMAEIKLQEVAEKTDQRTMRSALNAGAVYKRVQRAGDDANHYYVHSDFFKTLTALRGRLSMLPVSTDPSRTALPDETNKETAKTSVPAPTPSRAALPDERTAGSDRTSHDHQVIAHRRDRDYFLKLFLTEQDIASEGLPDTRDQVYVAAIAAGESFKELQDRRPELKPKIAEAENAARSKFERLYRSLKRNLPPENTAELNALDEAHAEFRDHWMIAMLLPGGPYEKLMESLVHNMEADNGAGRLSPEDKTLYDAALQLAKLMQDSPRNSAADWSDMDQGFRGIVESEEKIRQFPNVARS